MGKTECSKRNVPKCHASAPCWMRTADINDVRVVFWDSISLCLAWKSSHEFGLNRDLPRLSIWGCPVWYNQKLYSDQASGELETKFNHSHNWDCRYCSPLIIYCWLGGHCARTFNQVHLSWAFAILPSSNGQSPRSDASYSWSHIHWCWSIFTQHEWYAKES